MSGMMRAAGEDASLHKRKQKEENGQWAFLSVLLSEVGAVGGFTQGRDTRAPTDESIICRHYQHGRI